MAVEKSWKLLWNIIPIAIWGYVAPYMLVIIRVWWTFYMNSTLSSITGRSHHQKFTKMNLRVHYIKRYFGIIFSSIDFQICVVLCKLSVKTGSVGCKNIIELRWKFLYSAFENTGLKHEEKKIGNRKQRQIQLHEYITVHLPCLVQALQLIAAVL